MALRRKQEIQMQNKGFIRTFAVALALVCLYTLMFTFRTSSVEKAAKRYSGGSYEKEQAYLDSMSDQVVYNFLGMRKYTYKECKEREISLGLDLKGGMNVTLEVSSIDIIRALSNYSTNETFQKALALAKEKQKDSQSDFVTLFGEAFEEVDPNAKLASVFNTVELQNKVNFNSTNEEVLRVIRSETEGAIDNAFQILRSRIDKFGVVQPNIQQLETKGQILVELPGVKEPARVRKLLQGTANLEFWETYENSEIFPYLVEANARIKELEDAAKALAAGDTLASAGEAVADEAVAEEAGEAAAETSSETSLLDRLAQGGQTADSLISEADIAAEYPLFNVLTPNIGSDQAPMRGSTIGYAHYRDTAAVNRLLRLPQVKSLFPRDFKMLWSVKPVEFDPAGNTFALHAIKKTGRDELPPLDGGVVVNTSAQFDEERGGSAGRVQMTMNGEGARIWGRITRDNIGREIAIVLDDYVYSSPVVISEISGGNTSITGNFTITEAEDLANILKSGKLPAPARIIQDEVVGPSLGRESVRAGIISFILALVLVMIYLAFYYSTAGFIADIALLVNMFFLMGVMASAGVVLTLPGIAGIVLTLGMANDANVIIYERIREELRAGKGIKLAVSDGYKNAYSAILDGNITTFLVGLVLFFVGTGPIKGFANTLVLGILTSLFSALFITRLIFERMLAADKTPAFSIPPTENILKNTAYDFIGKRKLFYTIAVCVIALGLLSVIFNGFNYGIDFTGGRSYTVRFDQPVNTVALQESLRNTLEGNVPEVKTFGSDNQVKIITDYLLEDTEAADADSIVEARIFEGSRSLLPAGTTQADFEAAYIINSQKVGPTIADDIKLSAVIAIILALAVMFLYILIRFKNWRFGLGSVIALVHDATITICMYSVLYRIVPFSLEINQHFIAAILTIIGYSINDTVVIFDRIREYSTLYSKRPLKDILNGAVNSTLSRTMNTSLTTMLVLLVMFIWGGDVIRGFVFAMLFGVIIGTYSSVCIASPVVYDLMSRKARKEKK